MDVRTAGVELPIDSLRDLPYENDTQFADQQVSTHSLGANLIRRCGASSILALVGTAAGACHRRGPGVISFRDSRPAPRPETCRYTSAVVNPIESAAARAGALRRRRLPSRSLPRRGRGRGRSLPSNRRPRRTAAIRRLFYGEHWKIGTIAA